MGCGQGAGDECAPGLERIGMWNFRVTLGFTLNVKGAVEGLCRVVPDGYPLFNSSLQTSSTPSSGRLWA